jgi:hypothetical protein
VLVQTGVDRLLRVTPVILVYGRGDEVRPRQLRVLGYDGALLFSTARRKKQQYGA